MATTDDLKEYYQVDKMEEGPEKAELTDYLEKIDADNEEYVKKYIQADTNAFIADKVSPEVQDMNTVILCLRQCWGPKIFQSILDDYEAMKNFKPEFDATEAVGMPVEEAEELLQNVRKKTLVRFEEILQNSASTIEKSMLQETPLLADPSMATVLQAQVKEKQRLVYYKHLKAAVKGEEVTAVWKFDPLVAPENMPTPEQRNEADKLKRLVTQEVADAVNKKFEIKLAGQKSKLTFKDDQEKRFDKLFAEKQYWPLVKEELKKNKSFHDPHQSEKNDAEKPTDTSNPSAAIAWSPFGHKRRRTCDISANNDTAAVTNLKNVHKDQSVGQSASLECCVLKLPTQEEYPDGALGSFICAVGGEGGVAELDLTDYAELAEQIEEEAQTCDEGETVTLSLENVPVTPYKKGGRIKKMTHDESQGKITVKGKQAFAPLQVDDALLTPLTRLSDNLWQPVIVQGSFCKVQDKQTAKGSNKLFKNFALVDKHGNYVPCIAMGEEAVQLVEDAFWTPNAVVQICFAVARPAKENPKYPNENGKLWIFKNTLIIELGTGTKPPPPTREVQIRSAK